MKTSLLRNPLPLLALLALAGTAAAAPPAAPAVKDSTSAASTSLVFVSARKPAAKPAATPAAAPRAPASEAVSADGDRFRYDSCGCLGS